MITDGSEIPASWRASRSWVYVEATEERKHGKVDCQKLVGVSEVHSWPGLYLLASPFPYKTVGKGLFLPVYPGVAAATVKTGFI